VFGARDGFAHALEAAQAGEAPRSDEALEWLRRHERKLDAYESRRATAEHETEAPDFDQLDAEADRAWDDAEK
jgi:hypothetical protein